MSPSYFQNPDTVKKYRNYKIKVIDLNWASLGRPYLQVTRALNGTANSNAARTTAATMLNAEPELVLFGRNGTEALHYANILANVAGKKVVLYGIENFSTARNFLESRDYGNSRREDPHSTFADPIVAEEYEGHRTVLEKTTRLVRANSTQQLIDESRDAALVCIPHVSQTGKLYPITEIAKDIREVSKDVKILIDGAQALCNLPSLDMREFVEAGIDYYATVAHKHFASYPLGILCVAPQNKEEIQNLQDVPVVEQTIMEGMIDQEHGIVPNVSVPLHPNRLQSLIHTYTMYAEKHLVHGNDFTEKINQASMYADQIVRELRQKYTIQHETPIILSISGVPESVKKKLVQANVFVSHFEDITRVSVNEQNTPEDIATFLQLMQ